MASYYALDHPAERVRLFAHFSAEGDQLNGFLALARTGMDLFRPLLVPFVASASGLQSLLCMAMSPGEPALIHLPVEQRAWAEAVVALSEVETYALMRLDPGQFRSEINVLVMETRAPGGMPRFEIRSRKILYAAAGVNWMGPRFSEVYAEGVEAGVARGFRRAVLSAITGKLLHERRLPLLRVTDQDPLAQVEALDLGYRPTGERTLLAEALLRREPHEDGSAS